MKIGRNTVESAYSQLYMEGYIDGKPNARFKVRYQEEKLDIPKTLHKTSNHISGIQKEREYKHKFIYGSPDCKSFPHTPWKRLTNDVMNSATPSDLYCYGDKQGEEALRQEICKYIFKSCGAQSLPEQIVIGAGIQDIIGIICTLFRSEKPIVSLENPGHDVALIVFKNNGLDIMPVSVGKFGINWTNLQKPERNWSI